jgi:hypothetical protein
LAIKLTCFSGHAEALRASKTFPVGTSLAARTGTYEGPRQSKQPRAHFPDYSA